MIKTLYRLLFITLLMPVTLDRSWGTELIMFEQQGCEWCEVWDEEVGEIYHKTPEGKVAPLLRLDIFDTLPSEYDFINTVMFTPTFVLVDDGKEMGRITGYPGEAHFWGLLGVMLPTIPDVQASDEPSPDQDSDS